MPRQLLLIHVLLVSVARLENQKIRSTDLESKRTCMLFAIYVTCSIDNFIILAASLERSTKLSTIIVSILMVSDGYKNSSRKGTGSKK